MTKTPNKNQKKYEDRVKKNNLMIKETQPKFFFKKGVVFFGNKICNKCRWTENNFIKAIIYCPKHSKGVN